MKTFRIAPETVLNYLTKLEDRYVKDNPYHNHYDNYHHDNYQDNNNNYHHYNYNNNYYHHTR